MASAGGRREEQQRRKGEAGEGERLILYKARTRSEWAEVHESEPPSLVRFAINADQYPIITRVVLTVNLFRDKNYK